MYILMVAAECAPAAKVGNVADMVFGLSRELESIGHVVEIILPKYDCLRYDHIRDLSIGWHDFMVPWGEDSIRCVPLHGLMDGRTCLFIDVDSRHNFFRRNGYYGFPDDDHRFAFFSKAVLEFLKTSGKRPDVIHTHDWQTALTSVLLRELYFQQGLSQQRLCHTIHNFKYQGLLMDEILSAAGLSQLDQYHNDNGMQDAFNPSP